MGYELTIGLFIFENNNTCWYISMALQVGTSANSSNTSLGEDHVNLGPVAPRESLPGVTYSDGQVLFFSLPQSYNYNVKGEGEIS